MNKIKRLPKDTGCDDSRPQPFGGTIHGYVRLLAASPRHDNVKMFVGDYQIGMARNNMPEWLRDGAHVQVEFGETSTITLITAANLN